MLKNRMFLLLWFINIVTVLAIEIFTITVLVTVFEQTSSTLQAAGTMVARTLPAFLLGPVVGVLVDRFPRKNILIIMDVFRLLLVVSVIFLMQRGETIPVSVLYLIVAGLSAAGVFHQTARLAIIPALVDRGLLVNANSFILASNQIVLAVSYTLGGWLIQFFSLQLITTSVSVLFVIAILAALLLVVPAYQVDKDGVKKEGFFSAFISGWRYLGQHKIAKPLTIMETIEHVPHGIWTGALMLAFTIQALHGDTADWGYQVTGYFTGMIVGSLAAMGLNTWLRRFPGRIIVINACLSGLLTLAYASSQTVWIAVAWGFVFGPPFAIRDVAQDALLQGTVAENQLGRVYAAREMLRNIVFVFSGLFFAWLSDQIPIRFVYVLGGLFYLLTGAYAVTSKALWRSKLE